MTPAKFRGKPVVLTEVDRKWNSDDLLYDECYICRQLGLKIEPSHLCHGIKVMATWGGEKDETIYTLRVCDTHYVDPDIIEKAVMLYNLKEVL